MASWKVVVNINSHKEQKTVFVKDIDTTEEAELEVKRYFILERPEVDFWNVATVTKI